MPTIEIRNLFQLPHLLKIPELVCNENCETILKFSLSEVATIWFSSGVAVHSSLTEISSFFKYFNQLQHNLTMWTAVFYFYRLKVCIRTKFPSCRCAQVRQNGERRPNGLVLNHRSLCLSL